jgi:hypothetical protein
MLELDTFKAGKSGRAKISNNGGKRAAAVLPMGGC